MLGRTCAWSFALISFFPAVALAQAPAGWEDAAEESDAADTPDIAAEPAPPPANTDPTSPKAVPTPAQVRAPSAKSAPPKSETEDPHGCSWHCGWRRPEHALSFYVGPARLKFDGLSERLQQSGYEPLNEHAFDIGISATSILGDGLVLGLGLNYARSRQSSGPGGAELHAHAGQLYGMLGFTLARNRRWLAYPALLFGGYKAGVGIDASGSANFDQVLQNPGRSVDLEERGWFVGGMLAIDRRFSWSRDSSRYTSLGLRLGVLESVSSSGWRFGNDSAASGPAALPRVNFIAVALGFGRYEGSR